MSICFVKGCDISTCGDWGACSAVGCNAQGTETRVCTDPLCGPAEEQRTCTGSCMHFLFYLRKLVEIKLENIDTVLSFNCFPLSYHYGGSSIPYSA